MIVKFSAILVTGLRFQKYTDFVQGISLYHLLSCILTQIHFHCLTLYYAKVKIIMRRKFLDLKDVGHNGVFPKYFH